MNRLTRPFISTCLLIFSTALSAQTPQQLVDWVSAPDGWTKSNNVETFNPGNLHERINGAADAFLACKFEEMTTFDLTNNTDNKLYINISMYRHASPADAFCIYSGERSPDMEFIRIGAEGYITGSSLYFFAGSIYVKIRSHSSDPTVLSTIRSIGNQLAQKINPLAKIPRMVACFPTKDKLEHSECYISENFLGHSFLHSAYQATYKTGKKLYQIFIIECENETESTKILATYLKQTKQNKKAVDGIFSIEDMYNGKVMLNKSGKYLIGITLENNPSINTKQLFNDIRSTILSEKQTNLDN